jgi:aldehyde:ferredoxin oxidoreductase
MERLFNIREGFSAEDDALPAGSLMTRLIRQTAALWFGWISGPQFYRVRGWDENGIPTRKN